MFEVYPEVTMGDLGTVTIERPQAEVEDVRRRPHDRRPAAPARAPGTRSSASPRKRRSRRSSTSPARSTASSSPAARRATSRSAGRGPHAAAVRGGARRRVARASRRPSRSTFPDDYHGKEVAGKTASFALTVEARVESPDLPPLDDGVRAGFGVASGLDRRPPRRDPPEPRARARAQGRVAWSRNRRSPRCARSATFTPPQSLVADGGEGDGRADGGEPARRRA